MINNLRSPFSLASALRISLKFVAGKLSLLRIKAHNHIHHPTTGRQRYIVLAISDTSRKVSSDPIYG